MAASRLLANHPNFSSDTMFSRHVPVLQDLLAIFSKNKKSDLFEIGLCSANIFIKYTLPSDLIKRFAGT